MTKRVKQIEDALKTRIDAIVAELGNDMASEMLQRVANGMGIEPEPPKVTKEVILGYVEDLVSNFLYYNRKEDEDLPIGAIDDAVEAGEITVEDIVAAFDEHLRIGLES